LIDHGAASTEELALVGRHLELGGRLEEAAEYQRRAGDEAFKAGAYAAAVLHFSRSIELASSNEQMFELLARRERVLNALGRYSEQRDDAERLLALAEGLKTDELRTEALLRIGRVRLNLGEHQAALDAFKRANQIARRVEDPNIRARSLRWMAMYHFNLGEHLQARPLFEQALALAKESELDVLSAELAYELGVTVGTIGDYPQALDVSRQALEMFQKNKNRYQESFCLANIGCFHVYLGEYDQALEHLERAADLGREMRIPLAEASAQANLGNAYRLLGRFDEALSLELRVHKVAQRIGDLRLAADALIYGALASLGVPGGEPAGHDEQLSSERLAREALDLARDSGMPGTEAVAQMALARVLAHAGQLEPAVAASRRAVEILDQIGSVEGFEQEILLVHSELCGWSGLKEEAERALQRARKEIDRKASYISSASRRQRFVEQVGCGSARERSADGS
jgi:tetratricopeptide (TPR) repeat protein